MKSYVNQSCDKHTTDDHISYLSHWCVCIWMDFFWKTEVWSLFLALTCQKLVWGKELRIPDCLLLRSRVPVNGKGMFWITGGFKSPPATSEWQREQKKQRVLSFTEAETTTDNLGPCSNSPVLKRWEICRSRTQKKLAGRLRSLQRPAIPSWPQYHQLPFSDWLQHMQVNWQLNGNRCQNSS